MSRTAWVVIGVVVMAAFVTAAGVTYNGNMTLKRGTEDAARSDWTARAPTTVPAASPVADIDGPLPELTAEAAPSASFPHELSAEPVTAPRVSVSQDLSGDVGAG